MKPILVRLRQIITIKGISDSQFARETGTAQTTIANMFGRDSEPRSDLLEKVIEIYNVNPIWLLTGEGEMFSTSSSGALVGTEVMQQDEVANIPYYDIDVMAHIAESLDLKDEVPAGVLSIPGFQDCIACFPVYGSSMEPKISSGDVIAVSQAVSCDQILWGEIYLVITDAWRVVKTVHPGVTEEYIILRSINPAYAGDTNVNKKDLRALYLVRGVVSRLGM